MNNLYKIKEEKIIIWQAWARERMDANVRCLWEPERFCIPTMLSALCEECFSDREEKKKE